MITLDEVLLYERVFDLQYKIMAIAPSIDPLLVIGAAMNAYRLNMKGERYWLNFYSYIKKSPCMECFLKKYNPLSIRAKLRRWEKIKNLKVNWDMSLYDLWGMLAPFGRYSKTVLFTLKMFGYGRRHIYGDRAFPMDIPIPVDSRIRRISQRIWGPLNDKEIQAKWSDVAAETGIPPLHWDTLIWVNPLVSLGFYLERHI